MPVIQYVSSLRRTGVSSKSGKPYDYFEIHYIKDDPSFNGGRCTAIKKSYNAARIKGIDNLVSMQHYNAEFDDEGNLSSLSPVKV